VSPFSFFLNRWFEKLQKKVPENKPRSLEKGKLFGLESGESSKKHKNQIKKNFMFWLGSDK
jgi:hypothetical protein